MTAGDAERRAQALVDAAGLAAGCLLTRDVHGGLALLDRALHLLSPLGAPEHRAVALEALVARGRMLAALGADRESLAVQRELVARFADSHAPDARRCVVGALARGARLLERTASSTAGTVWAMRAIRAAGTSEDRELRLHAEAAVDVLRDLVAHRTGHEGSALEQAVIARLEEGRNPGASFEQARLLAGLADQLAEGGRHAGALEALDVAVRLLGDATEAPCRSLRLDVLLARARITRAAGFHVAALALVEDALDELPDEGDANPLVELRVLHGELLTMLGADEEAILAFARALDVGGSGEGPWGGHGALRHARRAWGVLQVAERLDLDAMLVCHQAGLVAPAHLARAARRALSTGQGGRATRAAAELDALPVDAAVERACTVSEVLRADGGVEAIVDAESAERVRRGLCAAIVAGADAIALGWAITATELLPEAGTLSSGFIRALTRSYPGISTDEEVEDELVSRARRTLERAGVEARA